MANTCYARYMNEMLKNLTPAARSALLAAQSRRQGAKVTADPVVVTELFDLGLVGAGDGLTRTGTIAREKLLREAEDAAFSF